MTAPVSQVLSEAADSAIDAEVARIMAMSDDEIMREADAGDAAWARGFKIGLAAGKSAASAATLPDYRYANDAAAKAIYDSWSDQDGWVPWVNFGNSNRQEDARRAAALAKEQGR